MVLEARVIGVKSFFVCMSVQDLVDFDVEEGVPDWVLSANDVVDGDTIREEIGVSLNDCPRHRATVLHDSYSEEGLPEQVVRIECRVGEGYDQIGESYDISGLTENPLFIGKRWGSDPTYVSFYFELTDSLEEVCDLVH